MDPLNLDTLVAALPQTVDRAQLAVDAELKQANSIIGQQINGAVVQLSNLLSAALLGIQSIEGRTVGDVAALLASLDGWTAEIHATIRLTKPGETPSARANE